ncbi:MAG TPA: FAD-dependent oxidoreductase, partial [Acidimicrobiia bacterium]|nr:FAD-dependent oxidoreductase [Acidimicrobiia bacterium]
MTDSPRDDEAPSRPTQLARWLLGGGAALVVAFGLWLALRPQVPAPTTTTSGPLPTSTGPPTTAPITTTLAPTTTVPTTATTSPPSVLTYDVVVVGDGLGGASAATAAARLGANVALLSPIGYLGGQAGAAGVSTMDEGSNHFVQRRSGIYGELATSAQALYGPDVGDCYFIEDSMCPEPIFIDGFFRGLVTQAGADVVSMSTVTDVLQDGTSVTGVVADGSTYNAEVVIDATEFSDLYPMIEGLDYEVGSTAGCLQDTTWLAIRAWYSTPVVPELFPAESVAQDLRRTRHLSPSPLRPRCGRLLL